MSAERNLSDDESERALRHVALRTSTAVLVLQRRAEQDLRNAKLLLEERSTALSASVSLLNATLDSAPDGIVAIGLDGTVTASNRSYAAIWGLSAERVASARYHEVLVTEAGHSRDPDAYTTRIQATLADPETEAFDIVEFGDGRTYERKAVPQRLDGRCCGIVAHWRDITEQRRSAVAQLLLADQLRQAQKMESLGALSGGIAHDFNNIVSAILGNAELALASVTNTAYVTESLLAIREASERATTLVQQILTFSRRQPHERTPLAIADTVREAARLLRATIPAGVELSLTLDCEAPLVLADATQMHQIVINLATNALHALENCDGGVGHAGRIAIRVEQGETGVGTGLDAPGTLKAGRFVRLSVSDTGIGMTAATSARIFEPFFTTRGSGDGTGLGLSVVHGIVETHDGAITVESTPGVGTTFALFFPAIEADDRASRTTPLTAEAVRPETVSDVRTHVLYVDDDPMIVTLVSRLLARGGCVVTGFSSAREAVEALREAPAAFDLVISDFNMPGLSGVDIARIVLALRPDLPVIITSGYITAELQTNAEQVGVKLLLYKPDLAKRLLQVVRAATAAVRGPD